MPVVGTAGHVDHGKSTLVMALTGRDPDRWAEEKRRGLTIDIGFAWTTIAGREISFVDVPGHERYLKNMLAGIEVVDAALLVVAADEGWMPQTEEHLAVLDLLRIRRGVVALTKSDAVERDLLDLATLEIEDQLRGSTLESAPVVPVSGVTGAGMDELRSALVAALPPVELVGSRPRLWIDRSFSIDGAGTVVTGTLLDGQLRVGNPIAVYPGGEVGRIRGLQSHEKDLEVVDPRRRVAVNISGIERSALPRGRMLAEPGVWTTTTRFSAEIRVARYADDLQHKADYQLHAGSGAQRAEIQRVSDGYAVIRLSMPLPLQTGDRFILRDTGRKLVVAGGRVLDPQPGPLKAAMRAARLISADSGPDSVATELLDIRGIDTLTTLAAHSGGGLPAAALVAGDVAVSKRALGDLASRCRDLVGADHAEHPLRPGIPLATLGTKLGLSLEIVEALIDVTEGLQRIGPDVRSVDHRPDLSDGQRERWLAARAKLEETLAVPPANDLGLETELIHLLVRQGLLIRVSAELVILPQQADQVRSLIRAMDDGFTVAEFRDAAVLSRKYSVPFLEWADKEGLTIRRGDLRFVR